MRKMVWLSLMVFMTLAGTKALASEEGLAALDSPEAAMPQVEATGHDDASTAENTPKGNDPMVLIKTSKGDIKLKLLSDKAPITVENFLAYVDSGHYNGTIFHRVIPNFMIQGGGFTPDMRQKSTLAPIKNEAQNGVSNRRGTIAMARTQVTDSATSQFFINVVDNEGLNYKSPNDYGYCVFGEVVEGMDVVDAIRMVRTGVSGGHRDVPVEAVEIIEVVRVTEE